MMKTNSELVEEIKLEMTKYDFVSVKNVFYDKMGGTCPIFQIELKKIKEEMSQQDARNKLHSALKEYFPTKRFGFLFYSN